MRIVIDMQGWQASNRQRGIGRYAFALAEAIIRQRGENEILLAVNGALPGSADPLLEAFLRTLSRENICVWFPPTPVQHMDPSNDWRRMSAELLYESFLTSLKPDMVLITSLFEGLGDDAVTSIGGPDCRPPTAVVLYDLIPLINRSIYLGNSSVARWYDDKLAYLQRADLLLAISESSRREAVDYLGCKPEDTINISTAADSRFASKPVADERKRALYRQYGISRPFVMYTGGVDHRKNMDRLIRAFAILPTELLLRYQLAIICAISPVERERLLALGRQEGLTEGELVITGFVPEEDLLDLYNLCHVFVFPSWHEGFGLPALEAMACGRAVIAGNLSSLPEVVGREDALFNPLDVGDIAGKLQQVLTDDAFRKSLEYHGPERAKAFSWDETARRALSAMESWLKRHAIQEGKSGIAVKPRLAYVSPLPPERSGISNYSAELLPFLARYYQVDVVVDQLSVSDDWINANCEVRSIEWFERHAGEFDRILYHFGNSHFHAYMFGLLQLYPGVVVLHDFFLSGLVSYMEYHGIRPRALNEALYQSHGYPALQDLARAVDTAHILWRYPCNYEVLQSAAGVIVHSESSRRLAKQWYGSDACKDWAVIPLLRGAGVGERSLARLKLDLNAESFVVCSFGLLGPSKLNHRLLDVWLMSTLAADSRCVLVFVGENDSGDYGRQLLKRIAQSGLESQIRITGWTDSTTFQDYLSAADVGVQLRTLSRGETSAAVLDCMKHGLATIVNANGSMADLPDDGVCKLPDDFTDRALLQALETLWKNPAKRAELSKSAIRIIRERHDPGLCAEAYHAAIESFQASPVNRLTALLRGMANLPITGGTRQDRLGVAQRVVESFPQGEVQYQLLVDISELVQRDARTGIQRVVRSLLRDLLENPPAGYRVEPVYALGDGLGYRYARRFTLAFLDCQSVWLEDDPIDYRGGDIFVGLDFQPQLVLAQQDFYRKLRAAGVGVRFVVYDLLPIFLPHAFVEGAALLHERWLQVVAESDGAICISCAVADELILWLKTRVPERRWRFQIDWFHLGADVDASAPSQGLPAGASDTLERLRCRPSLLMVGTLEPRKRHAQVLDACERLWADGIDVNLVIVGKEGWMVSGLVRRLRRHPEAGKHLFWLEGISDEYLKKIYTVATCLILASEGEGFGLPLIEAAQHQLPIIARDIPIFREVAGDHAYYFSGLEAEGLAEDILRWLELYKNGEAPSSNNMPWLVWKQSAQQLLQAIFQQENGCRKTNH